MKSKMACWRSVRLPDTLLRRVMLRCVTYQEYACQASLPYNEDMTFSQMNMLVQPMRDELTQVGFQELKTPAEVDSFLADKTGTAVLMINSVCGCAAGKARPGVRLAIQQGPKPDRLAT